MGNRCTCPCSTAAKEECVFVMRADGSLLKFKKGTSAEEVAAAHGGGGGHRVVSCDRWRCCSVVPGGARPLECKKLYFLMPEEKAECRETHEQFWRTGEAKGLPPPRKKEKKNKMQTAGKRKGRAAAQWRPELQTIEEVASQAMSDLAESSKG